MYSGLLQTCTAVALIIAGLPAFAQINLKGFKDKVKRTVDQQIGAQFPGKPPSQGGSTPSANNPAAPAAAPVPAGENVEPWPDLAVDSEILAQQQAEMKKFCMSNQETGWYDCDCVATAYPEDRARALSKFIRQIQSQRDSACKTDANSAVCQSYTAQFTSVTGKEFQISFPNRAPEGAYTNRKNPGLPGYSNMSAVLPELGEKCLDLKAQGARIEQECLNSGANGGLRLPPGKSTTGFCGCMKDEFTRMYESGKYKPTSKDWVDVRTQADVACRK